jgi:septal ring factor EnvC (AmiA/AmiB activator)
MTKKAIKIIWKFWMSVGGEEQLKQSEEKISELEKRIRELERERKKEEERNNSTNPDPCQKLND